MFIEGSHMTKNTAFSSKLSPVTRGIHRVLVGQMFQFIRLILYLKMYIRGGLSPSSQTVGSLLIPVQGSRSGGYDLSLSIAPMC
jgi:hypothetical protein